MKKGYIFDLDGTLLDSMPVWKTIGRRYLLSQGITPPEGVESFYKTMTFHETALYFQSLGLKTTEEEMIDAISAMVAEDYALRVQAKAGALDYVKKAKEAGIALCALTASEKGYLLPTLERLGLLDYFSAVYTCSELNKNKQEPEIFAQVAAFLDLSAKDVAVFEDSLHCIQAAKGAGAYVVAVADEAAAEDRAAIAETADQFICDFTRLPLV